MDSILPQEWTAAGASCPVPYQPTDGASRQKTELAFLPKVAQNDRCDTEGPGEDAGSAHLQQPGSSLELLLQVGHRPLHIEDTLLMLQELLPAMVQRQGHLPQGLDFPLKFQRTSSLARRGHPGVSASHAAWPPVPSTGLLPGPPCSAS